MSIQVLKQNGWYEVNQDGVEDTMFDGELTTFSAHWLFHPSVVGDGMKPIQEISFFFPEDYGESLVEMGLAVDLEGDDIKLPEHRPFPVTPYWEIV